MNKINLVLLGGGGHCHSVIESIEGTKKYAIQGILETPGHGSELISGYPVIGGDELIPALIEKGMSFLVTVGHIRNPAPRKKLFEKLAAYNALLVSIIDKAAVVSERCSIGEGSVVLRNAFINSGVTIGQNCIINTGAIVEHDSKIGNHVHISTGAIVNGDCIVGDHCFIGSGAILSNNISICNDALIGAGAVVLRSVTKPGVYLGNPARFIK